VRTAIAILALALVAPASVATSADFDQKLATFHEHYNRFFRVYLGCPKAAVRVEDCRPGAGSIDYAEFQRARRAARDLFDLAEKPQ
jgi:hypothetical protein